MEKKRKVVDSDIPVISQVYIPRKRGELPVSVKISSKIAEEPATSTGLYSGRRDPDEVREFMASRKVKEEKAKRKERDEKSHEREKIKRNLQKLHQVSLDRVRRSKKVPVPRSKAADIGDNFQEQKPRSTANKPKKQKARPRKPIRSTEPSPTETKGDDKPAFPFLSTINPKLLPETTKATLKMQPAMSKVVQSTADTRPVDLFPISSVELIKSASKSPAKTESKSTQKSPPTPEIKKSIIRRLREIEQEINERNFDVKTLTVQDLEYLEKLKETGDKAGHMPNPSLNEDGVAAMKKEETSEKMEKTEDVAEPKKVELTNGLPPDSIPSQPSTPPKSEPVLQPTPPLPVTINTYRQAKESLKAETKASVLPIDPKKLNRCGNHFLRNEYSLSGDQYNFINTIRRKYGSLNLRDIKSAHSALIATHDFDEEFSLKPKKRGVKEEKKVEKLDPSPVVKPTKSVNVKVKKAKKVLSVVEIGGVEITAKNASKLSLAQGSMVRILERPDLAKSENMNQNNDKGYQKFEDFVLEEPKAEEVQKPKKPSRIFGIRQIPKVGDKFVSSVITSEPSLSVSEAKVPGETAIESTEDIEEHLSESSESKIPEEIGSSFSSNLSEDTIREEIPEEFDIVVGSAEGKLIDNIIDENVVGEATISEDFTTDSNSTKSESRIPVVEESASISEDPHLNDDIDSNVSNLSASTIKEVIEEDLELNNDGSTLVLGEDEIEEYISPESLSETAEVRSYSKELDQDLKKYEEEEFSDLSDEEMVPDEDIYKPIVQDPDTEAEYEEEDSDDTIVICTASTEELPSFTEAAKVPEIQVAETVSIEDALNQLEEVVSVEVVEIRSLEKEPVKEEMVLTNESVKKAISMQEEVFGSDSETSESGEFDAVNGEKEVVQELPKTSDVDIFGTDGPDFANDNSPWLDDFEWDEPIMKRSMEKIPTEPEKKEEESPVLMFRGKDIYKESTFSQVRAELEKSLPLLIKEMAGWISEEAKRGVKLEEMEMVDSWKEVADDQDEVKQLARRNFLLNLWSLGVDYLECFRNQPRHGNLHKTNQLPYAKAQGRALPESAEALEEIISRALNCRLSCSAGVNTRATDERKIVKLDHAISYTVAKVETTMPGDEISRATEMFESCVDTLAQEVIDESINNAISQ